MLHYEGNAGCKCARLSLVCSGWDFSSVLGFFIDLGLNLLGHPVYLTYIYWSYFYRYCFVLIYVLFQAHSVASSLSGALSYVNPASLFTFQPVQKLPLKDHQVLRQCGLAYFSYLLFYSGLEYSLSFLTHSRFQYTRMQQGKMYFVVGLVMAAVQGGYVHRVPPGKEIKVCLVGIMLIIPSFIIIGVSWSPYVLYCGLLLYAFSSGTVVPCLTTLVSKYGAPTQKGTILGIFRSLGALARALGPLLSATVYWWAGPVVCYCIGGCLFILPLLILRNLYRTVKDMVK